MKNLTKAIFAKKSGSGFEADIGGRLFKGRAPEGAQYPYAVMMVISDVPDKTFTETYEDVLIQFSLYSANSGTTEIEDMFTHLNSLYDECTLSITSETLIYMERGNASLMVEDYEIKGQGTTQVWHYAVEYEVKILRT